MPVKCLCYNQDKNLRVKANKGQQELLLKPDVREKAVLLETEKGQKEERKQVADDKLLMLFSDEKHKLF